MPLLIDSAVLQGIPPDTKSLFDTYPSLKKAAESLVAQKPKVVGPKELLYVCQRELAAVKSYDENITVLGSDDATTCHIVVLRHTGSGAVGLGHFDGCRLAQGVSSLIRKVNDELSTVTSDGCLELHVIGGFLDSQGSSEELTLKLLRVFHNQPVLVHLVTACVGELNNTRRENINWPIIYGVGVSVRTGEVFPATFPDRGPDSALRNSRSFTTCDEMLNIYDPFRQMITIGPFNYEPLDDAEFWMEQNDDVLRKYLSTSPEVEPPHFASQVRTSMKFLQENPFPRLTVFPDNKPHSFIKDENGIWLPYSSN